MCLPIHIHCILLSVCNVEVSWSHRLEFFKNNFMARVSSLCRVYTHTPTSWIYSKGNTMPLSIENLQEHKLLLTTYIKSSTLYLLMPKWMTCYSTNSDLCDQDSSTLQTDSTYCFKGYCKCSLWALYVLMFHWLCLISVCLYPVQLIN